MLVSGYDFIPPSRLQDDRCYFPGQAALEAGILCLLLRRESQVIGILPVYSVMFGQVLRGAHHVVVDVCIHQAVSEQGIKLRPSHVGKPEGRPILDQWSLARAFIPPDQNYLAFTQEELLGALDDGLSSGKTDPVHSQTRREKTEPGSQGNMTAPIMRVDACVHRVAEDGLVDDIFPARQAGIFHRPPGRIDSQFDGRDVLE
jgi:hypothetical protein